MTEYASSVEEILGQEFLTWLWYKSDVAAEKAENFVTSKGEPFSVSMEQRIVVQGGMGEAKETASVSGAYSSLSEARFGLANGKKVVRALLHFEKDSMNYQMVVKAEDFTINSLRTPTIEKGNLSDDDPDALFLEKVFLIETCIEFLDTLYRIFLKLRLSSDWVQEVFEIQQWMSLTQSTSS